MTRQILIAEDDAGVREFLAIALTGAGFETVEAKDGAAVLTRLAYAPPAMVLMDLHMPVMDGLEALRRLRSVESWAEAPVLFLTASGQSQNMVTARRLGARGYLVKPIRPGDLLARVQAVLSDPGLLWLDDMTQVRSAP
ncbi:response regulator transcription factor [Brevundimonas goettingensis]|uniref:Response regulator n=1 Tax=Brevundimonas goettingensis TaxID=2774190 RepID=A0A975BZ18_9CAUL|nr:response regulator [Brevundimonas goettingensis]QTC90125.1 response regulator [Brevundimonas goettingensis]